MPEKSLKSIHITNYYHKNSGGISYAYDKLLEAAKRHQRFVRLIVPGEFDAQEEINDYARIYYVKGTSSPFFDRRYRVLLPWKTYLQDGMPIRKILQMEMPDIVEIGEKYSLSLLAGLIRKGYFKSINRPLLVHSSCERMDDNVRTFISGLPPFLWFARRVMGNYNFPMFDFHLANSDYTAQELFDAVLPEKNPRRSRWFFNFCWQYFRATQTPLEDRVLVNNCGVDSVLFTPERKNIETRRQMLAAAGFPETSTVLLYAGRVSPEKNVKLLSDLMQSLISFAPHDAKRLDFRLLIAGDGPQADTLKKELEAKIPGRFKFLGHLSERAKLADLFANADVFVHPNPREPFGIAPLEAMASATPVLAPNTGGVLSYANQQNAWLESAKPDDFFAGIRAIFGDEEQRRVKVAKALETARKYTWERSTDNLFNLYDEMYKRFSRDGEFNPTENGLKKIDFASELFF